MQLKITKHLIAQGVFGSCLIDLRRFERSRIDQRTHVTYISRQSFRRRTCGEARRAGQSRRREDLPCHKQSPSFAVAPRSVRFVHPQRYRQGLQAVAYAQQRVLKFQLTGHRNIPEVFAWGRSQFFEYMVLQRLGPTLEEAFQGDNREPLSLRNMVILVCQMVSPPSVCLEPPVIHRYVCCVTCLFLEDRCGSAHTLEGYGASRHQARQLHPGRTGHRVSGPPVPHRLRPLQTVSSSRNRRAPSMQENSKMCSVQDILDRVRQLPRE